MNTEATLINRGNGLVYDTVDNISWTQDANIPGFKTWADQKTFAENLVLAGFDDFRLPTLDELTSLYAQLPGIPGSNKTGAQGPFVHIQDGYWSATERDTSTAFVFGFSRGDQPFGIKTNIFAGWAVRPGDSVDSRRR